MQSQTSKGKEQQLRIEAHILFKYLILLRESKNMAKKNSSNNSSGSKGKGSSSGSGSNKGRSGAAANKGARTGTRPKKGSN